MAGTGVKVNKLKRFRTAGTAALVVILAFIAFSQLNPSNPIVSHNESTQVAARPTEPGSLSASATLPPVIKGTPVANHDCRLDIAFVDKTTGYPIASSGEWYLVSDSQMSNVKQWPGGVKDQPNGPGAHIQTVVPCTWSGQLFYGNIPDYIPEGKPFKKTDLPNDILQSAWVNNNFVYHMTIKLEHLPPPVTVTVVITPTSKPTQTPAPSPTVTPTPVPTNTPTPIQAPTEVPSPTPSPTVAPTLVPAYGDFATCVVHDSQTRQPIAGAGYKVVIPKLDSVGFGTTNANGQLGGTAMNGAEGFLVVFAPPVYQTISDPSFKIVDGQVELNGQPGCDILLVMQVQPASVSAQSNVYPNGCTQVDDECHQTAILRSYPQAMAVGSCQAVSGYLAPQGTQVGYRGINADAGSIFWRTSAGEPFDGWLCNVQLQSGETVQVGLSRVCANIYIFPGSPMSLQGDVDKQAIDSKKVIFAHSGG